MGKEDNEGPGEQAGRAGAPGSKPAGPKTFCLRTGENLENTDGQEASNYYILTYVDTKLYHRVYV